MRHKLTTKNTKRCQSGILKTLDACYCLISIQCVASKSNMQVKTISYQRVKNLGNYESERMEMTIELDDDDSVEIAIAALKDTVKKALNITDVEDLPVF